MRRIRATSAAYPKWSWLLCLAVAISFSQDARSASNSTYFYGYPIALPLCLPSVDLQKCIDTSHKVRLGPYKYLTTSSDHIELRSGDGIYGLPQSSVPRIYIDGGSHDVTVSHISSPSITFGGTGVTSNVRLFDVHGDVEAVNARLVDNYFVRVSGSIHIDNSLRGYARNNVFIGCHTHSAFPAFVLRGLPDYSSSGNAIIWFAFQGQVGTPTDISMQSNLVIAGVGAESWNNLFRDKSWSPLLKISYSQNVYILGADYGTTSSYPTPFLSLSGGGNALLFDINGKARGRPLHLSNVSSPYSINDLDVLHLNGELNVSAIDVGPEVLLNKMYIKRQTPSPAEQSVDLKQSLPLSIGNMDWATPPAYISDVKGASNSDRLSSTSDLQKMIDSSPTGLVFLPSGKYSIKATLVLPPGGGIVGAGSGTTHIIGVPTLDVIRLANPKGDQATKTTSFILANVSIENGRSGLYVHSEGDEHGLVIQDAMMSDVVFANMSEAGVKIENIQGIDNNFFDHLTFLNNRIGFEQVYRAPLVGDDGHLNYVDKTLCFACRFTRNMIGISLLGGRQDNQNAWLFSSFDHNTMVNLQLKNNSDDLIAFSNFVSGDDTIDVDTSAVSSNMTSTLLLHNTILHDGKRAVHFRGRVDIAQ